MDSKYITIGKKTSSRCYDSEEWDEEKQGKTESELRIATRERHILPLLPLPFPHLHFFSSLLFSSLLAACYHLNAWNRLGPFQTPIFS